MTEVEIVESPVIQAIKQKINESYALQDYTRDWLNLRDMNITELPEDIFAGDKCSHLRRIILSRNLLTSLPENIFANCTQLQGIYLDHNQLTFLPENIFANCSRLDLATLAFNKLTHLPNKLFVNCPLLTYITLVHNNIEYLPEIIQLQFSKITKKDVCALDMHLYPDLLYYVDNLDVFETIDANDDQEQCVCLREAGARHYFPELCNQLEKYRRDPKNAKIYGWDIRRHAIIANEMNEINEMNEMNK